MPEQRWIRVLDCTGNSRNLSCRSSSPHVLHFLHALKAQNFIRELLFPWGIALSKIESGCTRDRKSAILKTIPKSDFALHRSSAGPEGMRSFSWLAHSCYSAHALTTNTHSTPTKYYDSELYIAESMLESS